MINSRCLFELPLDRKPCSLLRCNQKQDLAPGPVEDQFFVVESLTTLAKKILRLNVKDFAVASGLLLSKTKQPKESLC